MHRTAGAGATATDSVTVADAPLDGTAMTITPTEQATFAAAVASFTDGNTAAAAADFTATIDWGDGTTTPGIVYPTHSGFQVGGWHIYRAAGSETITVVVHDAGGSSTTITNSATVTAADTPNELHVQALYEKLLGRAPGAAVMSYWTKLLDNGTSLDRVAHAIVQSTEYDGSEIIKPLYEQLLDRRADASEVDYWIKQMQGGVSEQELEAKMIASEEFYKQAGGTSVQWVDAVFKHLLDRPADTSGEKYWGDLIESGKARSQVAELIANSVENSTRLIETKFSQLSQRSPGKQELQYWLAQKQQQGAQFARALAEKVTVDDLAVDSLYKDLLGRSPGSSERAYWSGLLNQGTTIDSVADAMVHSDEYVHKKLPGSVTPGSGVTITRLLPGNQGVEKWMQEVFQGDLLGGGQEQQTEAQFVASDEFFSDAGGTSSQWINSVYLFLLGRPAGPSGETYWSSLLDSGKTRSQVAELIADGTENSTRLIDGVFAEYAHRSPGTQELNDWLAQEQQQGAQFTQDLAAKLTLEYEGLDGL
ncbi:MAG: hypothetical protein B7Z73_00010 [Planctomycetia bacterium 21-64-5]|nr:MAG: hypothetical protein B7Z73_00010 [Planctomycetia bacterium 21-64-5]HQU41556.1 DUF4214 domain-containing protein [Pirellulales bacterium]